MIRVIIFFVIPVGIGCAVDALAKRDDSKIPGGIIGFFVGLILYGIFGHPYSGE